MLIFDRNNNYNMSSNQPIVIAIYYSNDQNSVFNFISLTSSPECLRAQIYLEIALIFLQERFNLVCENIALFKNFKSS
jgi:hypothetical protein